MINKVFSTLFVTVFLVATVTAPVFATSHVKSNYDFGARISQLSKSTEGSNTVSPCEEDSFFNSNAGMGMGYLAFYAGDCDSSSNDVRLFHPDPEVVDEEPAPPPVPIT